MDEEPRLYTMAYCREEYQRGYQHGKDDVWWWLADCRDRALCGALVVGILCCVAYTLTSLAYWLFS